jgi:hypothetical protein
MIIARRCMGASTHTFLALEPRAKLQAASVKLLLDMKDFMGYIINDGKGYTRGAF